MQIACIIPTLNEESALPATLASLEPSARWLQQSGHRFLVVIADGGSTDRTLERLTEAASDFEIHTVGCQPGRGPQIRCGVERALAEGAEVLAVVHADTRVPELFAEHLLAAVATGAVGGGCLVRFEPAPGLLRWAAPLVNARTRRFQIPLGDQIQWFTTEAWRALGGMRPWPILEDFDWIRRLRRHGPLAILPVAATTDTRRFRRRGPVLTVLRNWTIWTLYLLGVPAPRLARLYRRVR